MKGWTYRGAAVLVVTHDHQAMDIFDRALEMKDGLILGKPVAAG